jgi:hypothetical protein
VRTAVAHSAVLFVAGCGSHGDHASATPTPLPAEDARAGATSRDWPMSGYDPARTSDAPRGIAPERVATLRERRVALPGTVDSSPILLAGVPVDGAWRDVIVMTTTYGRTLALDAATAHELWRFEPASYGSLAGTPQITTATPVPTAARSTPPRPTASSTNSGSATATRSPPGMAGDRHGRPSAREACVRAQPRWRHAARHHRRLLRRRAAVPGQGRRDRPRRWPHHLGAELAVLRPPGDHRARELPGVGLRDLGPRPAVVNPADHHGFVTTCNGPFDGRTNWGDSVLELSPYRPTTGDEVAQENITVALLASPERGARSDSSSTLRQLPKCTLRCAHADR